MNIYLISQNDVCGYDTFDSAVVIAESEEDARSIFPSSRQNAEQSKTEWEMNNRENWVRSEGRTWITDPSLVTVKLIGRSLLGASKGSVCYSFNAG
jgi:hypothetical protein